MIIQRVEHNRRRLAMHVHICESSIERGRGLLFRRRPDQRTAYLLRRCSAVHTIGMAYALDIVFCNGTGRILRIVRDLRPFRLVRHPEAAQVWEVASGVAAKWGWRVGDEIGPC
ncbi:MAG: DUF192 domain-containing protein [Proteobacteria bacterium]|jgi:uncharacterized membrane protein (UPF0127 family)|nr:DUF192 domain-containing protein [Pseudomonadota bacterium]MBK7116377.1 DUF192 domain-containing protein [Pseudomonadota bacterium]MBK9253113.1 DUF192 domain-containing protein [Pseudomonadota bacterium]MCC6631993.1 DUF192 domain-containing protein [Gammaproteobacteria bacterium]